MLVTLDIDKRIIKRVIMSIYVRTNIKNNLRRNSKMTIAIKQFKEFMLYIIEILNKDFSIARGYIT